MLETTPSPESVVDAYHQAWTSGDVDGALTHLADDARCFCPDEEVTDKAAWRQYLTGFVPMLTGAPEQTRIVAGDRVALWYYPQTAITSTTLAAELFTVQDGQIQEIRLAFDRMAYLPPGMRPA